MGMGGLKTTQSPPQDLQPFSTVLSSVKIKIMEEALIVTSNRDMGMGIIDLRTGSSLCSNFKGCIAEPGAVCTVGSSTSSYSGYGSAGDYIAVAQSKKTQIHIYQWGKPQVHYTCHTQEIVTALSTDATGAFLFAGTMKGWIYCWELSTGELLNTFQAHLEAQITRIAVTKVGAPYLIAACNDGTVRAWEQHKILDTSETYKNHGKRTLAPFRSWSDHTLAIKDMVVFDSLTTLRVLTCSLDRTIVMYDVLQGRQCLRISLPQSLESISCNSTQDLVCAGSSSGAVYLVDLTSTAIAITAAHAHATHHTTTLESRTSSGEGLPKNTSILEGHTKAVSSLSFSRDNCTLVSASQDGSVRVWNVWTRQCLREYVPLAKNGISNAVLVPVPETLSIGVTRPTFCPLAHLNKYFKGSQTEGTATGTATSAPVAGATGASAPSSDASSSSLVLGPTFLGRRDQDTAHRVKEVHVVSASSTAKSPLKGRNSAVRETKEEDLGNMSFGADTTEEETAEMSQDEDHNEPSGQLVQEEEEFVAFSGSYELPKKSKIGSKKRRAAAEAEAEAQVEEEVSEEVHEEVKGWVVVEKPSDEEVAVAEAAVEVSVAVGKGNKKAKKAPAAVAEVPVVVEKVEKEVKEVKGKKGKAAKGAVMSADAFFSPAGKAATVAKESASTAEHDAESETDADKPAKKSVKFSASNSVKLITPHKLPGFTNGIQDATTTEKSKSGPKFTKKAAGKKK